MMYVWCGFLSGSILNEYRMGLFLCLSQGKISYAFHVQFTYKDGNENCTTDILIIQDKLTFIFVYRKGIYFTVQ